ncbi:PGF-CTERM sorting domain-containing protein [Salinarchaeum sp. Harcht-Bsk1]|uniref:DUF7282 domain-containing protein n=1 Tax=Salinarchaeum sp. Harcht-Bsk1 TaxID=1333523 RepID=UPI000B2189F9
MVVVLVMAAIAGAATVSASTTTTSAQDGMDAASVSFSNQTSGGTTVTVDEVTLPEGGFVTIHDDSLTDGDTFGSVVGTSGYLAAGTHENVTVTLESGQASGTYHAMAHQDTNGDRAYSFVASNGEADGPYTMDGNIVMDAAEVTATATVTASDQPTTGDSLIVDRVELAEGGFVTVHDSSLADGDVFPSIRGTSAYLPAGVHEDVRVQLDSPLNESDQVFYMAHQDTDGDENYTFAASEGEADGPYTDAAGEIVMAPAQATVSTTASSTFDAQTTGGNHVVVDSVFLPEGGFVTMHDSSLGDGEVFASIRGTSEFLAPGLHRDVTVLLNDSLSANDTLFAMAHQDTDGDETYTFPEGEGGEDGPYTNENGDIVMDDGTVSVAASVDFAAHSSDGTTVTVERVDLSEGGFVTIHDETLTNGSVFGSVRGTSEYLEPGVHTDVTITLDEPVDESHTFYAMAHQDTDGDETYTFLESEGENDGPYTAGGSIVMTAAMVDVPAHVTIGDQTAENGETITVDAVTLQNGGFVTIHDATLADGAVFDSVRGTSSYLGPGTHTDVEITLTTPLEESGSVFAMAHYDTDGDEAYTFLESEGAADGPYVANGAPLMGSAAIEVPSDDGDGSSDGGADDGSSDGDDGSGDGMDDGNMDDGSDADDSGSSDGSPGFGIAVALVALLGAALLARRRD